MLTVCKNRSVGWVAQRLIIVICVVAFGLLHSPTAYGLDFDTWLVELKAESKKEGISDKTIASALSGVTILQEVVILDRNQPEFTLTLHDYLERVVSPARIARGKRLLLRHREILEEVSKIYGVQPRFLVALWGIETDFGRIFGDFQVIDSLVTLAFDERRSRYFRKELLHSLHILDKNMIRQEQMQGSWAGAMGGLQFMPSVFRKYAVDHDHDGRVDLWRNTGDLFSSGGNYLGSSGWQDDQTWGRAVKLPDDFDRSLAGHDRIVGIREWQKLGVRKVDGSDLPQRNLPASLIIPEVNGKYMFLVYDNYRALLKWNRSDYFAIAVGTLSDRLGKRN